MNRIWLSNNDIRQNVRSWLWLNDSEYLFVPVHEQHDFQIGWSDRRGQVKLSPKLFQTRENLFDDPAYLNNLDDPDHWILTNCVQDDFSHPRVIYHDMIFNRTKAYYEKKTHAANTPRWYHVSDQCYRDINIHDVSRKTKIFVAPCWVPDITIERVTQRPQRYRRLFKDWISSYRNLGWSSDPLLLTNIDCPANADPVKMTPADAQRLASKKLTSWFYERGYNPPHDSYYADTFISFYVESFEFGKTVCLTEKTYDPLIKGHFVLPFGASGHVKLMREKGLALPGFIDYSYDQIIPTQKRFDAWKEEICRLLSFDLDTWCDHWCDSLAILEHNKKWFYNRSYDLFDLSILTSA